MNLLYTSYTNNKHTGFSFSGWYSSSHQDILDELTYEQRLLVLFWCITNDWYFIRRVDNIIDKTSVLYINDIIRGMWNL